MADSSMTSVELFDKVVRDEHVDLLREAVQRALQQIMAAEVTELLGAGPHERTESRRGWRQGVWQVPRDRALESGAEA